MLPFKTALITDLDNTLFDWVDLWFHCFSPMLDSIAAISGVPKDKLIPEIAAVHQEHGTSEYSFLIEEIPSLRHFLAGRSATEVFASSIKIYRDQRREHLKLYPTVAETLLTIKGRGTLIVGYTESMAFYSNYRIRRLGLDGVFDYIFCPEDHLLPESLSPDELRKYPAEHYSFKYTNLKNTPKGSKKPDKAVLSAIIKDLGLTDEECVYVGDSLMKDVAMAIDCGVADVWARYGQAHKREEYELLKQVTHWTEKDVEREQRISHREDVVPTYQLVSMYAELLSLFDFKDCRKGIVTTSENRDHVLEAWKTVVDVQKHFNDIGMRIRGMFVTILLALVASIGFMMDKRISLDLAGVNIQFYVFVPLFGIFGAWLFYFIDRYWFHRLLLGAVDQGSFIEKKYREEMPELSLGASISKLSPYNPGWLVWLIAKCLVKHKKFHETGQLHSDGKIELFYKSVMVVLLVTSLVLVFSGGGSVAIMPLGQISERRVFGQASLSDTLQCSNLLG